MMGVGKTTLGQLLAKRLNWGWLDTDQLLAEKLGCSILKFFELYGESAFRHAESALLHNLNKETGTRSYVISTGGGIILDSRNREYMKRNGLIINLDLDTAQIVQRVASQSNRPLLKQNFEHDLNRLLTTRQPLYNLADIKINITSNTIKESLDKILYAVLISDFLC